MSDIVDAAAQAEAAFLAQALQSAKQPETPVSYSHCLDCGDPIPEARQKAVKGCKLCVLCQEYEEKGWP